MAVFLVPLPPTVVQYCSPLNPPVSRRRPLCVRRSGRVMKLFATLSSSQVGNDEIDWVEATSSFFDGDSRPIMLFDGVCNLCNGGVKFVRDNDRKRIIRYEPLQSESGKKLLRRSGRAPDDISSVVLVEKDRSYIKSEAVLKIMEYLNLPFPQLALFFEFIPLFLIIRLDLDNILLYVKHESLLDKFLLVFELVQLFKNPPRFLRNFVYDNIANNRYTIFGRSDSCEI